MSDRHQELLRQHQLLREHLAWLEREIAREAPSTSAPAVTVSAPPAGLHAHAAAPTDDAGILLKDYVDAERHDPASTKKGCLVAFAVGLGLLIASVLTVYFLFYARR